MGNGVSMEKIRNLSLRKTIVLYTVISLLLSFFFSVAIIATAQKLQEYIWSKYRNEESYQKASIEVSLIEQAYSVEVSRPSKEQMNRFDNVISETCDFVETYGILVISMLGCTLAVLLFYQHKIKLPLKELDMAAKRVGKNDLDFTIVYHNKDELGRLCKEFEAMRIQLKENNQAMWQLVEEEKALRSAVAHDIRSPLAVLKGYQEMLLEFIPKEELDKDSIIEMLLEGRLQIDRMEDFLERMRKMSSLKERQIQYQATDLNSFAEQVRKNSQILSKDTGKSCKVFVEKGISGLLFDTELMLEVVENLLTNALRFAKCEIGVEIAVIGKKLEITVTDDGTGFQDSEEQVTKAYFHANPQDDLKHFGLGMFISRLYCEKHGGRLLVRNGELGGGVVKASIQPKFELMESDSKVKQ